MFCQNKKKQKIINIQFCGGCNCQIDRSKIVLDFIKVLKEKNLQIIFNNCNQNYDVLIFMSGCLAGCAFKFNSSKKIKNTVIIAGLTVDMKQVVFPKNIHLELLRKVQNLL